MLGWFSESVCENPVTYKIGTIDDEFDISHEKLKTLAENSSKMWEEAYGKELLNMMKRKARDKFSL